MWLDGTPHLTRRPCGTGAEPVRAMSGGGPFTLNQKPEPAGFSVGGEFVGAPRGQAEYLGLLGRAERRGKGLGQGDDIVI